MRKPKPRRSIIGHTTTCPYCGHRVLHKNLPAHVDTQHPNEARVEKFTQQISKSGLNACPYCNAKVELRLLEDHIREEHPKQVKLAQRRVGLIDAEERNRQQGKLEKISRKFGTEIFIEREFDEDAPWEWKLAEKRTPKLDQKVGIHLVTPGPVSRSEPEEISPSPQLKQSLHPDGWIHCSICNVLLKANNLDRHSRKNHPQAGDGASLEIEDLKGKQIQKGVIEIVYCKTCGCPVSHPKLAKHYKTHHS